MNFNKKYTAFYLLTAVFVLSLIPLFIIARYNAAAADDYHYGIWVHSVWKNTHSLASTLKAAYDKARVTYYEWQGTFSAIYVFSLQPAVFGDKFYCLVPVIMLGGLISSTLFFCRAFFGEVFGGGRSSLFIALVWLFVGIQMLPGAVEGFYWYNGSSYYTLFYSFSLFMFGLLIMFVKASSPAKKWTSFAGVCIFAFIIGGGNYITALITVLIFIISIAVLLICRNKSAYFALIPFALLLTAFFLSIAAPGNAIRQSYYTPPGFWKTIGSSFSYSFESLKYEANLMLLPWIVLLIPIFWHTASNSNFSFPLPPLVLVFTFCLYAAQFAPPMYAMGYVAGKRLENIIFYSYVFFLIFNVFYIVGWCSKKFSGEKLDIVMNSTVLPLLLLAVSLTFMAGYDAMPQKYVTTLSAVDSLRSGEAQAYYKECEKRLHILENPSIQDAIFAPYVNKPYLLYFDDISDDKNDWRNLSVTYFYGKESVVVQP